MFKNFNFLLSILIFFYVFIPLAQAYESDFPPYSSGKFPVNCQIHTMKPVTESDRKKGSFKSKYQIKDQNTLVNLHLDMDYSKQSFGLYLSLQNKDKKELMPVIKTALHPTFINKVYWAYLNKDAVRDFIIVTNSGDAGLMNGKQQAMFVLSDKGRYVVKTLASYKVSPKDFYDFSSDNKCEYLHQSFMTDGAEHYWVYNVLQFIGSNIVEKNALSRYFPKWIKLTTKPNSKAATLEEKRKKVLWRAYLKKTKNLSIVPVK